MSNKLTVIRQRNISCIGLECLTVFSYHRIFFLFHAHSIKPLSRDRSAPIKPQYEWARNKSARRARFRGYSASPNVLGAANCKSRESLISSVVVDAFRPPETGSSPFRVLYHGPVIGRYKYGCEATSTSCLYNPSRPRRTGFNHNRLIDGKHVQLRVLTLSTSL